jgi:putative oxidoreductase
LDPPAGEQTAAMDPVRALARASLGAVFISGGLAALRSPGPRAELAAPITDKLRSTVTALPDDDVVLVQLNGGLQVAAGTMLALGRLRRLSALALAVSLVPTTVAGHRFWEAATPEQRNQQRLHFTKNLAMFGGLLFAALDRGGEPSLAWRTKRQARRAASQAHQAAERLPLVSSES